MIPKRGYSVYERTLQCGGYEKFNMSFPDKKQAITMAKQWAKWLPTLCMKTGFRWQEIVKDDKTGKVIKVFK